MMELGKGESHVCDLVHVVQSELQNLKSLLGDQRFPGASKAWNFKVVVNHTKSMLH